MGAEPHRYKTPNRNLGREMGKEDEKSSDVNVQERDRIRHAYGEPERGDKLFPRQEKAQVARLLEVSPKPYNYPEGRNCAWC